MILVRLRKKSRSCCKCLYSEDGCFFCGEVHRSFERVGEVLMILGSWAGGDFL
jgi:hypothetical protein